MSPAYPAFSLLSCPHPPAPLPLRGRGRFFLYFAGGFAPGTPCIEPPAALIASAAVVPAGGLPSLSPAYPAFSLLSCPHPPAPLPPPGKGEIFSLFRRGLRPRHSCIKPFAAHIVPAIQVPAGGVPGRSPAYPAFSLLSCPLSPHPPSPEGKGEILVFLCKGLRPLHPRGKPRAALVRPAPGERTISNAAVALATDRSISPGPPLSLAAGTAQRKAVLSVLHRNAGSPLHWEPAWQGL